LLKSPHLDKKPNMIHQKYILSAYIVAKPLYDYRFAANAAFKPANPMMMTNCPRLNNCTNV